MGYYGVGLERIKHTPPRKHLKFSNNVYILHLVQSSISSSLKVCSFNLPHSFLFLSTDICPLPDRSQMFMLSFEVHHFI